MYSAFGVEHGEISKGYNQLRPKLQAALRSLPKYNNQNMDQRLRYNAVALRRAAGDAGKYDGKKAAKYAEHNQGWKRMSEASIRGLERRSKKTRYLP